MSSKPKDKGVSRAVELVAGEVSAILSSWVHTREMPDLAPDDAADLLAVWAHLQRFDLAHVPAALWRRLDTVVGTDSAKLCNVFTGALRPAIWELALQGLRQSADNAETNEDWSAADAQALLLFQQLDEAELALWAAHHLVKANNLPLPDGLAAVIKGIEDCGTAFLSNLDLFLPVGSYAGGLLAAYRADLLGYDQKLWHTIWKFEILVDEMKHMAACQGGPLTVSQEELLALSETSIGQISALTVGWAPGAQAREPAEGDVCLASTWLRQVLEQLREALPQAESGWQTASRMAEEQVRCAVRATSGHPAAMHRGLRRLRSRCRLTMSLPISGWSADHPVEQARAIGLAALALIEEDQGRGCPADVAVSEVRLFLVRQELSPNIAAASAAILGECYRGLRQPVRLAAATGIPEVHVVRVQVERTADGMVVNHGWLQSFNMWLLLVVPETAALPLKSVSDVRLRFRNGHETRHTFRRAEEQTCLAVLLPELRAKKVAVYEILGAILSAAREPSEVWISPTPDFHIRTSPATRGPGVLSPLMYLLGATAATGDRLALVWHLERQTPSTEEEQWVAFHYLRYLLQGGDAAAQRAATLVRSQDWASSLREALS